MVQALNPFDALKMLDRLVEQGECPTRVDLERPADPEDARALAELFAERHPEVEIHWNGGRFRRFLRRR